MAYDRSTAGGGPSSFGFGGDTISLASTDYTVPSTVKAIVVVATGNVVCRAVNGAADITITGAPVGFILPWHCLTIVKTGTTATLATIIG
jgi:hypothetical protein